jgi:hypothetical protein
MGAFIPAHAQKPDAGSDKPDSSYAPKSLAAIMDAMRTLESNSDAKCHSTASRFEDFLFGTPLSESGRASRTALQRILAKTIWDQASENAKAKGLTVVSDEELKAASNDVLQTNPEASNDSLTVTISGREIAIPNNRARQYASIAYSLRAMLGAHQESMHLGANAPLPLTPTAVDVLSRTVDMAMLAALHEADEAARDSNKTHIDDSTLRSVWCTLFPDISPCDGDSAADLSDGGNDDVESSADLNLALLRSVVESKLAAYRVYNKLPSNKVHQLFIQNIERFYVKYTVPIDPRKKAVFMEAYSRHMVAFSHELLLACAAIASTEEHRQIRLEDAYATVQQLLPHQVDEFEDVHFFGNLVSDRRITLESYDCDSYRDSGFHWGYLHQVFQREDTLPDILPDPEALEVLAETVSQYGVLLLRVAGSIARESTTSAPVSGKELDLAKRAIHASATDHRTANDLPSPHAPQKILSSSAAVSVPTIFLQTTTESGVSYAHNSSHWLSEFRRTKIEKVPTFSGGGLAADDIDGDGSTDLVFAGGRGNALYLNDGTGVFRDVTESSGIDHRRSDGRYGEARHPILADFDNDGLQDLFISYVDDPHRLYRNVGDGQFEDHTDIAQLQGAEKVGGATTVFDVNDDGLLDIYISYFGNYLLGDLPYVRRHSVSSTPNELYLNRGEFRFELVTSSGDLADTGWAQAVSHTDFDNDGKQDIIVANDFGLNMFLRNQGAGQFKNIAPELGITKAFHSMNVGTGDLNGDSFPDIYISNITTMLKDNKYVMPDEDTPVDLNSHALANMLIKESDVLYLSVTDQGALTQYEPATSLERPAKSMEWSWDAEFFDADLDGDDDLYVVNGTNDYNYFSALVPKDGQNLAEGFDFFNYGHEPNVFYTNQGGVFQDRSGVSGLNFAGNSRSAVYLDLEGDGDLDIAVNNFHAPARLFRNTLVKNGRHWLAVRLIGDVSQGVNRDAIGSRVTATTALTTTMREIQGGSGYLSSEPKTAHFGLGTAESVRLDIRWPNGEHETIVCDEVDRIVTYHQSGRRAASNSVPTTD